MLSVTDEIDRNYDYLQRNITRYLPAHEGEFALLHNRQIIGFFPTPLAAEHAAAQQLCGQPFSIQEISSRVVDLGFFSHAVNPR